MTLLGRLMRIAGLERAVHQCQGGGAQGAGIGGRGIGAANRQGAAIERDGAADQARIDIGHADRAGAADAQAAGAGEDAGNRQAGAWTAVRQEVAQVGPEGERTGGVGAANGAGTARGQDSRLPAAADVERDTVGE